MSLYNSVTHQADHAVGDHTVEHFPGASTVLTRYILRYFFRYFSRAGQMLVEHFPVAADREPEPGRLKPRILML
ncbi:hypothetical protein EYF80_038453 [Liparis tanakae]|uniref:Uncharacterized protein n=1 Tax=Liparis tanakae TaxID=230148 RepID=A0A4Z2GDZ1_9TELE|nr:hypothetical protein EYF80_038453 [Liparis tanakae]